MAENTKIEWCDATFNPWVGCTKVSPACDHCYAEGWAKRTGHPDLWQGERRRTSADNWKQPLKWDRQAAALGVRRRVFCASLADVFDNQVPREWRDDLWDMIATTRHLDWLLLTKRPQNIAKMLPAFYMDHWPWPNVWLGTTAENQEEADRRIPHLLAVPAAVHFLSVEPLLGPLSFRWAKWDNWRGPDGRERPTIDHLDGLRMINWVIVGGESGPHARPMHPDWARSLRDQCEAAGVPYFFKQWGEWRPCPDDGERVARPMAVKERGACAAVLHPDGDMVRVGKKLAGRLLDGREWNGMPDLSGKREAA